MVAVIIHVQVSFRDKMGEFYTASCFLGKGKQLVIRSGSPVSTLSDFRSKDAGGSHFLSRLSGRFIVW